MTDGATFSAGERLGDPIGDPSRQAVAALRGFSYQLHASALAWLGLQDGETLHLEVAEDYSIAAREALEGVQVKDTAGSGAITIRHPDVVSTINSLVDLTLRNPERSVKVRHLTTAPIGRERALEDRIDDGPALLYWRRAASGANVAQLREILLHLNLSADAREFIVGREDEVLRADLLRRIHWDAGALPLDQLTDDLEAGMVEFANATLRLPGDVGRHMAAEAPAAVLRAITKVGSRSVRRADLIALGEAIGRVSLPRSALEGLLGNGAAPRPRDTLLARGEIDPPDGPVARRGALVGSVLDRLTVSGFAVVTGSTGMGKTFVASQAAMERGSWDIGDLRDLDAVTTARRVKAMAGEAEALPRATVVLDDLGHADSQAVRSAVSRLVAAARRRDGAVIATSASPPSKRTMIAMCGDADAAIDTPYLAVEEVGDLIEQAGGGRSLARLIHLAGSGGHPQLVQAAIIHMRSAGWSRGAVRDLVVGEVADVEEERRGARDRIVAAMPENRRIMLLRASMVLGRFPRSLALALADVDPRLSTPGLELDQLIGPWIERPGRDLLRVSPLVQFAGDDALSPDEKLLVHRKVADHFLSSGSISVTQGDMVLHHSLRGGNDEHLKAYGQTLVTADTETLELLARHAPLIVSLDTDAPIPCKLSGVRAMLRLGQLLVALSGDDPARAYVIWKALDAEMKVDDLAGFQVVVLSKILITTRIVDAIPEWVDLLIRFDELCRSDPNLRGWAEGLAPEDRLLKGAPSSFAFLHQAMGLREPARLRAALEQLDGVGPEIRESLFSALRGDIGHFGHLIDSSWMSRARVNELDGEAASADYLAMADLAHSWGEISLAARCYAARAVMLDEIVSDPARALHSLEEAADRLGPTAPVSRAKAKIHWRSRDHETALRELEAVWAEGSADGDIVERGFIAREAAISAAETGRWSDARTWFERARESFPALDLGSMQALRVGLLADAAQAAFRAGDAAGAIAGYTHAIEAVSTLDPQASLANGYCHRVVRHAVLWIMAQVRSEPLEPGLVSELPPGSCSNPDPSEEILERPLGTLDVAWYLLADAALDLGDAAFFYSLHSRLAAGPILGLEVTRARRAARHALEIGDADEFFAVIPSYVAGLAHLIADREGLEKGDLVGPTRGVPEPVLLDGTEPEVAARGARDMALSFGVLRAFRGECAALARIRARMGSDGPPTMRTIVKLMAGAEGEARDLDELVASTIAQVVAAEGEPVDPDVLLTATVRFVLWIERSEFKAFLEAPLATWVARTWSAILNQHRFRLRDPQLTVPAIEAALAHSASPLAFAAALALAAEPATRCMISGQARGAILRIASSL